MKTTIKKYSGKKNQPELLIDNKEEDNRHIINKAVFGQCLMCGNNVYFKIHHSNLRETVNCPICESYNRQRQLVAIVSQVLYGKIFTLEELVNKLDKKTKILLLEDVTNLAGAFKSYAADKFDIYTAEYISDEMESGEIGSTGIMHLDIHDTNFKDNYFDLIIHADVFEHVVDAPKAEKEQLRILKKGGYIVYTAPFTAGAEKDDLRAIIDEKGKIKYLQKKEYHGDPAPREDRSNKNGCLVFRTFSYPDLFDRYSKLNSQFTCYGIHATKYGILGDNGFVLTVTK